MSQMARKWEVIEWRRHAKTTIIEQDSSITTGKRVIADVETSEETARRIVACWNACHGIPTEDLERYYNNGGGIDEAIEHASLADQIRTSNQLADLQSAALKLALESECLLMDCKDNVITSRWWDSLLDAIETVKHSIEAHP